jgi:hypothetical protein
LVVFRFISAKRQYGAYNFAKSLMNMHTTHLKL